MLLFLIAFASLGAAAYFAVEAVTVGGRERRTAVRRASSYGRLRDRALFARREELAAQTMSSLKEALAKWVVRLTPKLTVESVTMKLMAAGLSRRLSPTGFIALKGVLGLGAVLVAVLVGVNFLFALMAGVASFFIPDIYVTTKARRRREEARIQLPDALDILAVSVEAGLAFDAGIAKLVEHMGGPLAEEFALTLGEIRIGRGRQEALKQADQLGISLGRILRIQATDTRQRRQAAAEEKAMKAPIKMIPPTAVFIFPAIFLVILGPAFLNLGDVF